MCSVTHYPANDSGPGVIARATLWEAIYYRSSAASTNASRATYWFCELPRAPSCVMMSAEMLVQCVQECCARVSAEMLVRRVDDAWRTTNTGGELDIVNGLFSRT